MAPSVVQYPLPTEEDMSKSTLRLSLDGAILAACADMSNELHTYFQPFARAHLIYTRASPLALVAQSNSEKGVLPVTNATNATVSTAADDTTETIATDAKTESGVCNCVWFVCTCVHA